tara:strand:+ start:171 stop:1472 length:1302 start_codon:yes stop_codon:yes gene_type:complete
MAIDYGNYVQSYGGGVDLSPLTQGINQALEKNKKAQAGKISNFTGNWWDAHTKNFETAAFGDVDTWIKGTSTIDGTGVKSYTPLDLGRKDPMTALLEFKKEARSKLSTGAFNEMLNSGHFDPANFKKQYEEQVKSFVPLIERKLLAYKDINHLSDDKIKEMMSENKSLQRFVLDYSDNPDIRGFAIPDRTALQWYNEKFGEGWSGAGNVVAKSGALGILGTSAYKLSSTAYDRYAAKTNKSRLDTGLNKTDTKNLQKSIVQDPMRKVVDPKTGKVTYKGNTTGIQKGQFGYNQIKADKVNIARGLTETKADVTRAQTAINTAKKKFVQSGGTAKTFVQTAEQTKRLKAATDAAKLAKGKVPRGLQSILQSSIKRHGKRKVIGMIMKKVGLKGAMSLLGKLGLAAIPGGQVLSGVLLAADIAMIYGIIHSLASD